MLYRYSTNENGRAVKSAIIYTKNEHSIKNKDIDVDALKIIYQLNDYGYQAYLVGGAVRDLLLGKKPKDFDIVTEATPTQIKKIFRNSRIIGKRFRLVHVFFGPKFFEVSTFRSNENGSVGNVFGTIEQDVKRRDFSLNALYYDIAKEQIIDYCGGVEDIKKNVLKPLIALDRIFTEDPVRIIRAIKYSSANSFKMNHKLQKQIKKNAHLLNTVSPSRLTEELLKIINSGNAYKIFSTALKLKVFEYLQPNAYSMMMKNKEYETAFLESMKKLDERIASKPECDLGEKLYYLIKDYTDCLTDWKTELEINKNTSEIYRQTWKECRNFVLPMNPQRTELEKAIKKVLKDNGITVRNKKPR
ncbi:MAG: polynucleotide adenylyltransferase PcnB [Treponemataceae bacterium]|nr:polynucleotide adenylyltransferase PcnB [Treponemataceae bacterium]